MRCFSAPVQSRLRDSLSASGLRTGVGEELTAPRRAARARAGATPPSTNRTASHAKGRRFVVKGVLYFGLGVGRNLVLALLKRVGPGISSGHGSILDHR